MFESRSHPYAMYCMLCNVRRRSRCAPTAVRAKEALRLEVLGQRSEVAARGAPVLLSDRFGFTSTHGFSTVLAASSPLLANLERGPAGGAGGF